MFAHESGIDLMVTAVVESLGGTPIARRVLIQNGKQFESLVPPTGLSMPKIEKVGDSAWLTRITLTSRTVGELTSSDTAENQEDPFAQPDPTIRYFIPATDWVKPPKVLRSLLDHEVLDARKWFEAAGMGVKDDEFFGYDPLGEWRIFIHRTRYPLMCFNRFFLLFIARLQHM